MNAIGAEFIADHDYPAPVFHVRSSAPEKETVKKRPSPPHEVDSLFTPRVARACYERETKTSGQDH
jgi:hypothetical protein